MTTAPTATTADRPALLRRGLRLEYLTVGWNIIEVQKNEKKKISVT